jgi:glycerol-3-phosphate dehydrogenase
MLVECVRRQPDLARRIDPTLPVTLAEVEHAVHHEMAWTLLDVIQRRTEIGSAGLPSMTTLQKCAELMGRELRWTAERQGREIDSVPQAYPFKQVDAIAA